MNCPKCGKKQCYVCGNPECVCAKQLPEGALPQVYIIDDILACPYCGFEAHIDYWEEREMEEWDKEMKARFVIVQEFYDKVCKLAESNIEHTGKLEGAHYAAMQTILKEYESKH